MFEQYFDTIKFRGDGSTPPPYQDDRGNWITPDETGFNQTQIGRAETNSKAASVPTVDGKMIVYTWLFYMPKDAAFLKYDQDIQLFDRDGNLIDTTTVKAFKRGTFNARLWL